MRVCVVCHEGSLTGAPRIGFDIAAHLRERHEVTLLAKRGGPLAELPQYQKLRDAYRVLDTSHEVSDQTYRQRVARAAELLAETRPDLLYVNSVSAGEWCEAGSRVGVPVVLHTHETRVSLPSLLSSVCTPRVLSYTDLLVGASRGAVEDLQTLTSTRAPEWFEFGICVDAAVVRAGAARAAPAPVNAGGEALPASRQRPTVAMCGLAQPRKGADIFLAAARRAPQLDFVWIGPWSPPEADLNAKTHERFVALKLRNLYSTGLTDNPYAHLSRADVFVLTSREDPNPLVVVEALLLGCKTVAFAETGASVDLLARFGYALSGAPDAERIAGLLPRILASPPGRWQEAAAERVREAFDSAAKLAQLEQTLTAFHRQWTAERRAAGANDEAP